MTEHETPETSLRDELTASYEAAADAPPEAVDQQAPPVPAELPPLEAPPVWGSKYKEVFQRIAQTPEQRANAEAWLEQWKETQGYVTKKEQEAAEYRKRFEPLHEVIRPYEGYWHQQGMDAVSGVRQLVSYAEQLARDPRAMIPQLAQMYGVDLSELVADQPYIDPQVAQLQAELQAMRGGLQQQQMQQQQQQYHRLTEEVRAFETATDEQGNPRHPHFARVFDQMIGLARGGLASTIQDAYEKAVYLDKDLQTEISAQRAQSEAVTRAAEAKKALDASRTVRSKAPTAGSAPERTIREELAAQLDAAGFQ